MALKIFQMAAQRAFPGELIALLAGNQSRTEQPLDALGPNRPTLAFGEGLAQKGEI